MRYLFLDPGETTGYVFATQQGEEDFVIGAYGEAVWPDGVATLATIAVEDRIDAIVIEDFIVRQSLIGDRVVAIKVIGAFELLFGRLAHWPVEIVFQQPSEKQRAPDQLLVRLGYWNLHGSAHVRDAFRHLIIYRQKQKRAPL